MSISQDLDIESQSAYRHQCCIGVLAVCNIYPCARFDIDESFKLRISMERSQKERQDGGNTPCGALCTVAAVLVCVLVYYLAMKHGLILGDVMSPITMDRYTRTEACAFDITCGDLSSCYVVNGTVVAHWDRKAIYSSSKNDVVLEYWREHDELARACAFPDHGCTHSLLKRLECSTTEVVFVGDSLLRNLANGLLDVIYPPAGFHMNPVVLLGQHQKTHSSMINYVMDGPDQGPFVGHFTGWNDGVVQLQQYDFRVRMMWRPWYPPMEMLDPACAPVNGSSSQVKSNQIGCFEYTRTGVKNRYLDAWLNRGAQSLETEIEKLPSDALLVFGYPDLSLSREEARPWMFRDFVAILKTYRHRCIFVSHLREPGVQQMKEILQSENLTVLWYGQNDTAPDALWYDAHHVWGPIQDLVSRILLHRLASL